MKEIFCENFIYFIKSVDWLKRSYFRCKDLDFETLTEEDIEKIEALANRFARSVDILINRLLRSLDILELEDISRRLDIVIRAEKRGFIENFEELIELKNLRNELSHEYLEEVFIEKVYEIIKRCENIFIIENRIKDYVKKYGYCEDL